MSGTARRFRSLRFLDPGAGDRSERAVGDLVGLVVTLLTSECSFYCSIARDHGNLALVGPMARYASDLALSLDVIAGPNEAREGIGQRRLSHGSPISGVSGFP
jgi:hypothetical protein